MEKENKNPTSANNHFNPALEQHWIIESGDFKLDGGAMYGIIPKPLWDKKSPPDEENRIQLSMRLWLISKANSLVIIDTGIGNYQGEDFNQRFAVQNSDNVTLALKKIGKTPDDVTDVIFSHLHFDHAGGLITSPQHTPQFRNAIHHIHREHYYYALNPTDRDRGSFQLQYLKPAIELLEKKNQIQFHSGNEGILIDSLSLQFKVSMGHTPFLMHPYNPQFIYLADLIPTSHHIRIPWVMGYDIYPGQSVKDKKVFLDFATALNLTVLFEHDPDYFGATVALEKNQFVASKLYPSHKDAIYWIANQLN